MKNVLSEDKKLVLVVGCKIAKQDGAIWCTSNPKLHAFADEWVIKGWLLETTEKYFSQGAKDLLFCNKNRTDNYQKI